MIEQHLSGSLQRTNTPAVASVAGGVLSGCRSGRAETTVDEIEGDVQHSPGADSFYRPGHEGQKDGSGRICLSTRLLSEVTYERVPAGDGAPASTHRGREEAAYGESATPQQNWPHILSGDNQRAVSI
jgi:hypothetical protein